MDLVVLNNWSAIATTISKAGPTLRKELQSVRKWTRDSIAEEIRTLHTAGSEMHYAKIAEEHVALLRAATRYFGSWRAAVDYAGIPYEAVRRYKTWTRERILERIMEESKTIK